MSGRDTLLQHFPEEGKELCDTLEASGKVDFSERNIQAVNQRRLEELYPDERLERETLSSDSAEDTDSNNEEANEEESEETSATEELTFSSESSQEEGLNDALGEPDSNT